PLHRQGPPRRGPLKPSLGDKWSIWRLFTQRSLARGLTSAGHEPAGALGGVDDLPAQRRELGPDTVGAVPVPVPPGAFPCLDLLGGAGRELVPGGDLPG